MCKAFAAPLALQACIATHTCKELVQKSLMSMQACDSSLIAHTCSLTHGAITWPQLPCWPALAAAFWPVSFENAPCAALQAIAGVPAAAPAPAPASAPAAAPGQAADANAMAAGGARPTSFLQTRSSGGTAEAASNATLPQPLSSSAPQDLAKVRCCACKALMIGSQQASQDLAKVCRCACMGQC